MAGAAGELSGEGPGATADIQHPLARAWQLPQEQPVVIRVVVPIQLSHMPIMPDITLVFLSTATTRRVTARPTGLAAPASCVWPFLA